MKYIKKNSLKNAMIKKKYINSASRLVHIVSPFLLGLLGARGNKEAWGSNVRMMVIVVLYNSEFCVI